MEHLPVEEAERGCLHSDGDLPAGHGGPLRLRVPRQLSYKSLKCLTRLTVRDDLNKLGREMNDPSPEYAWYAGI
jgi:DMSO/TMAO reductase YedYZ molybdopterin-dependent catalytic subunit